jgi:hypothetical protein
MKLGRLSASGTRGGDVAPSFSGTSGASVDTQRGHDCVPPRAWLLVIPAVVPSGSRLRLLHSLSSLWCEFRARRLDRLLSCRCYQRAKGSSRGPFCRSEVWGVEKSTGGGGAVLAAEGVPSGLRRLVLN